MSEYKLTRQEAIEQNCKDCQYDELAGGTWKDQVEACPSKKCPFYEHRPVSERTRKVRQEAKIAVMTPEQLVKYRAKQEAARIRLNVKS